MISIVKSDGQGVEHRYVVNRAGLKREHRTLTGVAQELGIDSGELHHQLSRRKGFVLVVQRDGKHWYA